jgi:hypothetical protein
LRQNVLKKLSQLEEHHAAVLKARQRQDESKAREATRERFRKEMIARGVVQGPHESFMDAVARSMGMKTFQLRGYFRARASGQAVQLESFQ